MKSNTIIVNELLYTKEGQRMFEKDMLPEDHTPYLKLCQGLINPFNISQVSENLMRPGFVQIYLKGGAEMTVKGDVIGIKQIIDKFIAQQSITVTNG